LVKGTIINLSLNMLDVLYVQSISLNRKTFINLAELFRRKLLSL